uniref:DUF1645 domain-containing protein n=1 Tax=Leersia perrieri TaxID=77586 RepID=A0A0D9WK47_9ORYZ
MEERIPEPTHPQSPTAADAVADDVPTAAEATPVSDDSDAEEFEFEFPFVTRDSPALADDLFADGRIKPFYPVFAKASPPPVTPPPPPRTRGPLGRLFLEESSRESLHRWTSSSTSSSSAASDEGGGGLDGAPPESYCLWTPGGGGSASASPRLPPRKSGSTGSMARWRRISELVVGRSHSDGKEKFLFLPTPPPPPPTKDHGDDMADHFKPKPKPPKPPTPAAGGRKPPEKSTQSPRCTESLTAPRAASPAPAARRGGRSCLTARSSSDSSPT